MAEKDFDFRDRAAVTDHSTDTDSKKLRRIGYLFDFTVLSVKSFSKREYDGEKFQRRSGAAPE